MALDGDLLAVVLAVFLRVVSAWYRKQVDVQIRAGACPGSVTVAQSIALTDPSSIRSYLESVGLSAEIPKLSPASAPPRQEFDFDN